MICKKNSNHRYGSHLSKCPWCEREAQFSGVARPTNKTVQPNAPRTVTSPRQPAAPARPVPLPTSSLKARSSSGTITTPNEFWSTFWDVLTGVLIAGFWLLRSAPWDRAPVLIAIGAVTSVFANRFYGGSNHPNKRATFPSHVLAGAISGGASMFCVGLVSMVWDANARGQGVAAFIMLALFFWMFLIYGVPLGLIIGVIVGTIRTVLKR